MKKSKDDLLTDRQILRNKMATHSEVLNVVFVYLEDILYRLEKLEKKVEK